MVCPRCKGSLRTEKYHHVKFDICNDCRGIWVSGQQFRALAVLLSTEEGVESNAKLTFEARRVLRASKNNPVRFCPHCEMAMREFNYAYDSNIFLDRCEQCKGIWLDPNEIIDIAKHIQYNPQVHAVGGKLAEIVKMGLSAEDDLRWYDYLLPVAYVVLRLLVFRR